MAVGLQFFPWAGSRAVCVSPWVALGTVGACCSHHGSAPAPQTGPAASCCTLLCLGHFLPRGVQRPLTLPSEQALRQLLVLRGAEAASGGRSRWLLPVVLDGGSVQMSGLGPSERASARSG